MGLWKTQIPNSYYIYSRFLVCSKSPLKCQILPGLKLRFSQVHKNDIARFQSQHLSTLNVRIFYAILLASAKESYPTLAGATDTGRSPI